MTHNPSACAERPESAAVEIDLPLSINQESGVAREVEGAGPFRTLLRLELEGDLDLGALQGAFDELIRRHESLRTGFRKHPEDGSVRLLIAESCTLPIAIEDLRAPAPDELDRELEGITREAYAPPFDLERPPLMRVRLLRLTPATHIVIIVIHHVVCDGWSMNIVQSELQTLYDAFHGGRPSPLAELSIQHADVAAWERDQVEAGALDESLAYWTRQWQEFGDALPTFGDLPFARPARTSGPVLDRREEIAFDPALLQKLRGFLDRKSATLFIAVLTSLAAAFHVITRKTRVAVWGQFSNRTRAELEGIIGWLSTTHLLGVRCESGSTLLDLFQHVREVVVEAQRHQEVPIATLRAALAKAGVAPFGIPGDVLNLALDQTFVPGGEHAGGLRFGPVRGDRDSVLGGLRLMIVESPDGIGLKAMYAAERLLPIHISGLLTTMRAALDALVETPTLPVAELGRATSTRGAAAFRASPFSGPARDRREPRTMSGDAR